MAIIKCKMCGGDLEIVAENSVAVCEYCGTQQTVPSADNEKKLTLFGRANRLRMACEFDKAAGVYESIVVDFPEEAEAYWGLVLCKYGIEYVDDPATGKKIPTCHRSSFDSIMDDANLDQALENADAIAQKVYREEAKQFERIRKGILEVSSSEKPYDIFICYKETDEKGDRTLDSVLAQDLYAALTDKGYRVFFSRITLQGKLGEAYEPYIFAALNSAKVMLAVGSCYEYYNAVWVKNEWSRYLKICEADKSKHLIPCYKDLDPEDMPKEFRHLQGADLGKMGAVQDILFNMEKYIPLKKETVKETVVVQQSGETTKVQALLDRGSMALEDGEWAKADGFFEEVLNNDAKCAWAYVGKTLAQERCKSLDAFVEKRIAIGSEVKAEKATIPADEAHIQETVSKYVIKNYLNLGEIRALYQYDRSYVVTASSCEENYKQAEAYWNNHKLLTRAESFATGETAERLRAAKDKLFSELKENIQRAKEGEATAKQTLQERYRVFLTDADDKAFHLRMAAEAEREDDYQRWAECAKNGAETVLLARAVQELSKLDGYKESSDLITLCNKRIDEIRAVKAAEAEEKRQREAAEAARLAAIKAEEERIREIAEKKRAAKNKRITVFAAVAIVVVIVIAIVILIISRSQASKMSLLELASDIKASEIIMIVDGRAITAEEYLYTVVYASQSLSQYGITDLNTDLGDGITAAEYVATQAESQCVASVVLRAWAEETGVTLDEEDKAQLQAEKDAYGDAAAFEQTLQMVGVSEETFDTIMNQEFLYNRLYDLYCAKDGVLYPDDAALEALAEEHKLVTAYALMLDIGGLSNSAITDAKEKMTSYATQLSKVENKTELLQLFASEIGCDNAPQTFGCREVSPLTSALMELSIGEVSSVVEDAGILYVLLRTDTDLDVVSYVYFSDEYNRRIDEAVVEYNNRTFNSIDIAAFYAKYTELQKTLYEELGV